jgi:hypothetical protein
LATSGFSTDATFVAVIVALPHIGRMVKKIIWSVLVLVAFVLVWITSFLVLWDRDVEAELVPSASSIPLDWRSQIERLSSTMPRLSAFRSDSAVEGNAADVLYSIRSDAQLLLLTSLYYSIEAPGLTLQVDSAVSAAFESDTALNGLVAASSMNDFNSTERIKSLSGGNGARSVIAPDGNPFIGAVRALLVRSELHSRAAEHAQAREDVAAVLRLGHMIYQQSAVLSETVLGRQVMGQGAGQLFRYAVAAQDTAAFEAAQVWRNWVAAIPPYDLLILALGSDMDEAVRVARNTDVIPAWRGLAIEQMVLTQYRPKNILSGIPSAVRASISNFQTISDPRVAWQAEVAENSIDWFNGVGMTDRVEFLRGVSGG